MVVGERRVSLFSIVASPPRSHSVLSFPVLHLPLTPTLPVSKHIEHPACSHCPALAQILAHWLRVPRAGTKLCVGDRQAWQQTVNIEMALAVVNFKRQDGLGGGAQPEADDQRQAVPEAR